MRIEELIKGVDVRPVANPQRLGSVRVCDLTEDSRTVVPGSLFIARRGDKSDGRTFIPAAVAAGAVAVLSDQAGPADPDPGVPVLVADDLPLCTALLAERFYGEPSSRLCLLGITGTNGKTTIAYLLHQLLNGAGTRCGMIGTVCIDDGTEVAPASLTTPMAPEISLTLSRMVEAGCRAAAMEVSSHALDQKRVAGLSFRAGVFTNLTGDHLDYHGDMETYAAAKAMLFESLASSAVAIVNAHDPWSNRMLKDCRASVVRCGLDGAGADCSATVLDSDSRWSRVRWRGPWGEFESGLPLIGRHNVLNSLQAAACAHHACGLGAPALKAGLERVSAPPGRLEPVTARHDPFQVFVDYAHSDDSLRTALEVLRALRPAGPGRSEPVSGRVIVVFGCGGDRDRTKRPRMGAVAASLADKVVVTSDNPRSERPSDIIDEILAGVPAARRADVSVQIDRARAIEAAIAAATPGDLVLIAGKGHEDYQIVRAERGELIKKHFDDREEARRALRERAAPGALESAPSGGRHR